MCVCRHVCVFTCLCFATSCRYSPFFFPFFNALLAEKKQGKYTARSGHFEGSDHSFPREKKSGSWIISKSVAGSLSRIKRISGLFKTVTIPLFFLRQARDFLFELSVLFFLVHSSQSEEDLSNFKGADSRKFDSVDHVSRSILFLENDPFLKVVCKLEIAKRKSVHTWKHRDSENQSTVRRNFGKKKRTNVGYDCSIAFSRRKEWNFAKYLDRRNAYKLHGVFCCVQVG